MPRKMASSLRSGLISGLRRRKPVLSGIAYTRCSAREMMSFCISVVISTK